MSYNVISLYLETSQMSHTGHIERHRMVQFDLGGSLLFVVFHSQ